MNKKKNILAKTNYILNDSSPFYIKEAYNTLRTNIIFSLPKETCKVIAITSAMASEGKSTNSVNIALSFAQMGAKVLLIDCDLRKPNIARLMNKQAGKGISNVLVNMATIEEVVSHSEYENLDIIYSGDIPPNPSELLGSNKMKEVLDALAESYDYIMIDTPPVNIVTDASVISKYVDGIVMVVRQYESKKENVSSAIAQLEFAKVKILGLVLNGCRESGGKSYRYKKSYYKYEAK